MKISYVNFKKEFPVAARGDCCFKSWFNIQRLWDKKLINISVRHHQITIDLRGDWVSDLTTKTKND